ncbi:cytochrome P450 [Fistulina hepatica ATCC 64428]|uniref:Cytochrome P450 n=1 Tax=Fistulina hepatica ATCC 64428 TaxID=1128425 RepID=A0A0D7A526_9AGAR|nr:cytochrome P450 [Fistulina hepatica ATCC 64428]
MPAISIRTRTEYGGLAHLALPCKTLVMFLPCTSQLNAIPTIGFSWPIFSYISAIRFVINGNAMIHEGYEKVCASALLIKRYQLINALQYPIFKIANFNRWIVIIRGRELTEQLRKARDNELSFIEAANEMVQIPCTLGSSIANAPYHVHVLSTQLPRNMHSVFPEIRAEMISTFDDLIPRTVWDATHPLNCLRLNILQAGTDWMVIPAADSIMTLLARMTNRMMVGQPLCRDGDYLELTTRFSRQVVVGALVVSMFPRFLRPLAARFCTSLPRAIRSARHFLGPVINQCLQETLMDEGILADKPHTMLSWLLAEAKGDQRTPDDIARRVLALNFAANHTTSMAPHPKYQASIRWEVEDVTKRFGWTKDALDSMVFTDSFLRESMRPFVFMVGNKPITVPAGTLVFTAARPTHFDEAIYGPDAHKFKADRFVPKWGLCEDARSLDEQLREPGSPILHSHQLVTTSPDFLSWGIGRHACPGRVFAATEMKLILAYIATHFDVLTTDAEQMPLMPVVDSDVHDEWTDNDAIFLDGERPEDIRIEANCFPNIWAGLRVRRRENKVEPTPLPTPFSTPNKIMTWSEYYNN